MKYTRIIGFEDIKVSLIMVWKNSTKCLITALCFLAIGIILTMNSSVNNYYNAYTTLYCPINGNYSEASVFAQVMNSYASLVNSQKVAERAVSIMGNTSLTYRDIQEITSYSLSSSGINLTISAVSGNPEEAVEVANAVANAFVEEMRTMTDTDTVRILSTATTASLSQNGLSNLWMRRFLFFFLGYAFMAFLIFILELFSDKLRSVDQCIISDNDVILGIIPRISATNEK